MPFTINRSNAFASPFDVSFDAALDVGDAVSALVSNEFEPVTIDRVSFLSSISTAYQQWTITSLDVSVNGGPFRSPEVLTVEAGNTLRVRARMRPYRSTAIKTSLFTMTVPANTSGRVGSLVVTGGAELAGSGYEATGSTLNSLINGIKSKPRGDEVVARLDLEPLDGGRTLTRTAKNRHSQTVIGELDMAVEVN